MSKDESEDEHKKGGQLKNPFQGTQKKGQEYSVKYCAWEVLKHYCDGLNVTQIAKEIQERGLKDFSEKKNAAGQVGPKHMSGPFTLTPECQVSGDLVRGKGVFWHDPQRKLWWIRPLAPLPKSGGSRLSTRPHSSAKKSSALRKGKTKPHGQALVGARVAVWWDGEKTFFEGRIVSYDASVDRFRIVYDDGDADESIQFRKYEVVKKNGSVDLVTVLQHNLDDLDMIPASTSAVPKVMEEQGNNTIPERISKDREEMIEKTAGQDSSSEAQTASTDEWKPTPEDLEQATPESDNQGSSFRGTLPSAVSSQVDLARPNTSGVEQTTSKKAGQEGHQHNFAGKERPKGRKGPGRPPKRSCALGAQNSRGVKRRKSANSAKNGNQRSFEVAPNHCESPARHSSASDSPPECAPAFVGDSTPDEHNSRGGEAEGSTCNNSSTVPQEKFVKHVVEGPDGNSAGNALFEATDKQVLDATIPSDANRVEAKLCGDLQDTMDVVLDDNEVEEDGGTDGHVDSREGSGLTVVRRKRSVRNRGPRGWGSTSLSACSIETPSKPLRKSQKSSGSGNSSHNCTPETSCDGPRNVVNGNANTECNANSNNTNKASSKRNRFQQGAGVRKGTSVAVSVLNGLAKGLGKTLERGASIDMLDLTKGLFAKPCVMEPPLGQLGNVGELMSLSQLSEELKSKEEAEEEEEKHMTPQRDTEVSSAPQHTDNKDSEMLANITTIKPDPGPMTTVHCLGSSQVDPPGHEMCNRCHTVASPTHMSKCGISSSDSPNKPRQQSRSNSKASQAGEKGAPVRFPRLLTEDCGGQDMGLRPGTKRILSSQSTVTPGRYLPAGSGTTNAINDDAGGAQSGEDAARLEENKASTETENAKEDGQRSERNNGGNGQPFLPTDLHNSDSGESTARINGSCDPQWSCGAHQRDLGESRIETDSACLSNRGENQASGKRLQLNISSEAARPPLPSGAIKWGTSALSSTQLQSPCPVQELKKRFQDWPYPAFLPQEGMEELRNSSEL